MQNISKVEKFNLSGFLLFGLINDAKNEYFTTAAPFTAYR